MKITDHKDASNRYTVEISDMPVWMYSWTKWRLRRKFNLKGTGRTVVSLDERFQELKSNEGSVSIDWDIWGGFMVTSLNGNSDDLVMRIKKFLESKYA